MNLDDRIRDVLAAYDPPRHTDFDADRALHVARRRRARRARTRIGTMVVLVLLAVGATVFAGVRRGDGPTRQFGVAGTIAGGPSQVGGEPSSVAATWRIVTVTVVETDGPGVSPTSHKVTVTDASTIAALIDDVNSLPVHNPLRRCGISRSNYELTFAESRHRNVEARATVRPGCATVELTITGARTVTLDTSSLLLDLLKEIAR